ncbi:MAG: hypothetical protein LBG52_05690 [Candidatus Peribacteria bacterium]|jgi:hypothetical protein|nr:hypothetical protein [Candidatus Peribacteria bacterium]
MNPEGLNNSLQNIPDIKEKTMKEAREYIDRDDNCDKVGRRMNMHCKEIKQEMENMKSFSKKIA